MKNDYMQTISIIQIQSYKSCFINIRPHIAELNIKNRNIAFDNSIFKNRLLIIYRYNFIW